MTSWPDRRIQQLLHIELPIIQAPMAGAGLSALAIAVADAGGLGSLPCALLTPDQVRAEVSLFRQRVQHPLNLNFFCHRAPLADADRAERWQHALQSYYKEFSIDLQSRPAAATRTPFDTASCELVEQLRPEVVSFHFGLPDPSLLERVRASGAKILSSATTVAEARWLEQRGCDAIIAQGCEAGGHRGMFLGDDLSTQVGSFALLPRIVDAVRLPVIAAGGIGDARGIVAAFALGASAVQIGTAYLFCPEATISPPHREALRRSQDSDTALTNVFTGRPARGIVNRLMRELGPISEIAPAFPLAGGALAPLRAKTEPMGSGDFMPLWSGQAAALAQEMPAGELTRRLAEEALRRIYQPSF